MALTFLSRLQVALLSVGYTDIILRVEQVIYLEAPYLRKDLLAVLPTGYGKSLVFHVLPRLLKERDKTFKEQEGVLFRPNMKLFSLIQRRFYLVRKD